MPQRCRPHRNGRSSQDGIRWHEMLASTQFSHSRQSQRFRSLRTQQNAMVITGDPLNRRSVDPRRLRRRGSGRYTVLLLISSENDRPTNGQCAITSVLVWLEAEAEAISWSVPFLVMLDSLLAQGQVPDIDKSFQIGWRLFHVVTGTVVHLEAFGMTSKGVLSIHAQHGGTSYIHAEWCACGSYMKDELRTTVKNVAEDCVTGSFTGCCSLWDEFSDID
eukprot:977487-Pleurochrysis_carterae.AAC.1